MKDAAAAALFNNTLIGYEEVRRPFDLRCARRGLPVQVRACSCVRVSHAPARLCVPASARCACDCERSDPFVRAESALRARLLFRAMLCRTFSSSGSRRSVL